MANFITIGGPHSKMDNVLASHPGAPGSILGLEIYRQRCCLDLDSRGIIMLNEPSSTSWWQASTTKNT